MELRTRILNLIFRILPQIEILKRFCRRYLDSIAGDNNHDISTNGELLVVKRFIPRANIVFDIGSNRGEWAELAFAENPKVEIHCFEPSKATCDLLLKASLPGKAVINQLALGATKGRMELHVFGEGSAVNSLYRRSGLDFMGLPTQQKCEDVEIETFDSYRSAKGIAYVDFAKIDVEGHELEVLRGMSASLREGAIGALQFEYGGCNIDARVFLKDIWEYLSEFPYALYKIHPQQVIHHPRYRQDMENFRHQVWLAIRKGLVP